MPFLCANFKAKIITFEQKPRWLMGRVRYLFGLLFCRKIQRRNIFKLNVKVSIYDHQFNELDIVWREIQRHYIFKCMEYINAFKNFQLELMVLINQYPILMDLNEVQKRQFYD